MRCVEVRERGFGQNGQTAALTSATSRGAERVAGVAQGDKVEKIFEDLDFVAEEIMTTAEVDCSFEAVGF